jgi:branched-chain amino acid transport system permease protein
MNRKIPILALGAVTLLLPLVLSQSQLATYILFGLAAVVVIGLTLLMGHAGQVSLGHGAFYGMGGYAAGLLSVKAELPTWVGLLAAPLVAGLLAAVIGIPLLRLRGHQLAFATLAMQLIFLSLMGQADWAGAGIGLQGIEQLSFAGYTFEDEKAYAYLVWAAVVLVLVIAHNVVASRPGRGLRALSTSEVAAESAGVPVVKYKLAVFSLSAAFAGLAGGIYCFYIGYVSPDSFPVMMSFEFVVMATVGGLGTLWGALVGAALITLLLRMLNDIGTMGGMPDSAPAVLSYSVYAVLLIVVVLFLPKGIAPGAAGLAQRLPFFRSAEAQPVAKVKSGHRVP